MKPPNVPPNVPHFREGDLAQVADLQDNVENGLLKFMGHSIFGVAHADGGLTTNLDIDSTSKRFLHTRRGFHRALLRALA